MPATQRLYAPKFLDKNMASLSPVDSLKQTLPMDISGRVWDQLSQEARLMEKEMLQSIQKVGGDPWHHIHDKHNISLYCGDLVEGRYSQSSSMNVHAESTVYGKLNDIAKWNITSSSTKFADKMRMLSNEFIEASVVANLVLPGPDCPYLYIGLKWMAYRSSSPTMHDCDYLVLEYADAFIGKDGRMHAFCIMKSVDGIVGQTSFGRNHGQYERHLLPLTGYTFHTTAASRKLEMTYSCNMDIIGELPSWAIKSGIQVEAERKIQGQIKFLETCRAKEAVNSAPLRNWREFYDSSCSGITASKTHLELNKLKSSGINSSKSMLTTKGKDLSALQGHAPVRNEQAHESTKGSILCPASMYASLSAYSKSTLSAAMIKSQEIIDEAAAAHTLAQRAREMFHSRMKSATNRAVSASRPVLVARGYSDKPTHTDRHEYCPQNTLEAFNSVPRITLVRQKAF